MKLKLFYKIFIANLGILFVFVLAMQGVNYFSKKSLIDNFVVEFESQRMIELSELLQRYHFQHGTWDELIQDPQKWRQLLLGHLTQMGPFPRNRNMQDARPQPPFSMRPPTDKPIFDDAQRAQPRQSLFDNGRRFNRIEPHLKSFVSRVSLLDSDENTLIGNANNRQAFIKIADGDQTIGWLALSERRDPASHMFDRYMQQQQKETMWVAAIGGVVAVIFSLLLSRHITAPIKQLTTGASLLAKRQFTTQISVQTNDELQTLANSFNQLSSELLSYEIRQKQWLMDIAHELRTPLTILNGELEAIIDGVVSATPSAIASLKEEVAIMTRLVNDLHQLSLLDSTEFNYHHQSFNLVPLLNGHIQKYALKLAQRQIKIASSIDDRPLWLNADQERLSQVIQNILENVFRYVDSGGQLYINATRLEKLIVIDFDDSGPGVSPSAMTKLFDRLYRTDSSRNRKTGGAGLGLAICKMIVEAHQGNIIASQSDIGGLRIRITLPLGASNEQTA
ncbi:ATP-binding protein [Alteromonadaceae bacterium BrNp21-10]|nr:ATP-binding protein [Alteromonadaceae bacterium BrNp21-10]